MSKVSPAKSIVSSKTKRDFEMGEWERVENGFIAVGFNILNKKSAIGHTKSPNEHHKVLDKNGVILA